MVRRDCILYFLILHAFLISFDISSLYTIVPVNETINILCNMAFSTSPTFSGFNESQFHEMLSLIFDNTFFLFNESLYKQTDGLAMGNPLALAMANIFLCNLEQQIFDNCPQIFRPSFYRRYLYRGHFCNIFKWT